MARYTNGINGRFSGKVGSIIFTSRYGTDYAKGAGTVRRIERTADQRVVQDAFGFVSQWQKPLKRLVRMGFDECMPKKDGWAWAMAHNKKHALISTEAGWDIDYARVCFSRGELPGTSDAQVEMKDEETLLISWNTGLTESSLDYGENKPAGSDTVLYFVYFPQFKQAIVDVGSTRRSDGKAEVFIPGEWRNSRLEVQIAFKSQVTNRVSTSQYAGGIRF